MIDNYPDCYRHVTDVMSALVAESPGVMERFIRLHAAAPTAP